MHYPNALIAGTQKCGTTWLAKRLAQHPEIFVYEREIHFFDNENNYKRGKNWYASFFRKSHKRIRIEKCGAYLWTIQRKYIPQRIKDVLKNCKLIFILRDPVQRVVSAWNHLIYHGHINPSFDIDDIFSSHLEPVIHKSGLLERGLYYSQIKDYLSYFSWDDILILYFEDDIIQNPRLGLTKVCSFLQVDSGFEFYKLSEPENVLDATKPGLHFLYKSPKSIKPIVSAIDRKVLARILPNLRFQKSKPSDLTYRRLVDFYKAENRLLKEMTGYIPSSWISE